MENKDKEHMRFLASCFAMNGLLQGYQSHKEFTEEYLAQVSVECADALIKELESGSSTGGIVDIVPKRKRRSAE